MNLTNEIILYHSFINYIDKMIAMVLKEVDDGKK
tara:strand:- start:9 stop:110 length:102 start_codon:yes stop_codon:yes gene_type:complete